MIQHSFLYKLLYDECQDGRSRLRLDLSGLSGKELKSFMNDIEDLRYRFYGAAASSATLACVAGDDRDGGHASSGTLSTSAFYVAELIEMGDTIGHVLSDIEEVKQ